MSISIGLTGNMVRKVLSILSRRYATTLLHIETMFTIELI